MMAAGQAAVLGAETLLLEKMDRPGRKLCMTGGGRCNLTHMDPLSEFITHIKPDGRFLYQAFTRFFILELIGFLEGLGVRTVVEEDGRVFPSGGRASDVLEALMRWVHKCGVTLLTETPIKELLLEGRRVVGVSVSSPSSERIYRADAVIIATGGASYPATGSTGDGYRLAQSACHTLIAIRPAQVPLITAGNAPARMQGVSLNNVAVRLWINEKKQMELSGEMLFTHFGVSGPIPLSMSRQVVDALRLGHKVNLSIDLKPELDEKNWTCSFFINWTGTASES